MSSDELRPPPRLAWAIVIAAAAYTALAICSSSGNRVVYWASILLAKTGSLVTLATLLVFPVLFFRWMHRRRSPVRASGMPDLFAGLAAFVALLVSVASSFAGVVHADSAKLDRHTYYLAIDPALDADDLYILYECDAPGVLCASRRAVKRYRGSALPSTAKLIVDEAAHAVLVSVGAGTGAKIIASYSPSASSPARH